MRICEYYFRVKAGVRDSLKIRVRDKDSLIAGLPVAIFAHWLSASYP